MKRIPVQEGCYECTTKGKRYHTVDGSLLADSHNFPSVLPSCRKFFFEKRSFVHVMNLVCH